MPSLRVSRTALGSLASECPRIPFCPLLIRVLSLSVLCQRGDTADPDMNWAVKVVALGQLTF